MLNQGPLQSAGGGGGGSGAGLTWRPVTGDDVGALVDTQSVVDSISYVTDRWVMELTNGAGSTINSHSAASYVAAPLATLHPTFDPANDILLVRQTTTVLSGGAFENNRWGFGSSLVDNVNNGVGMAVFDRPSAAVSIWSINGSGGTSPFSNFDDASGLYADVIPCVMVTAYTFRESDLTAELIYWDVNGGVRKLVQVSQADVSRVLANLSFRIGPTHQSAGAAGTDQDFEATFETAVDSISRLTS